MIEETKYDSQFFESIESSSNISAMEMLPWINELLHPGSVIDVGCGTAEWLSVWSKHFGVQDIMGIEGPYVDQKRVKIPLHRMKFYDLKQPLIVDRKFDLAMSLEVAEHLPIVTAGNFVRSLTELSDVVLFSAAIPGQGGTHHINEQYPEYWAQLFKRHDFVAIDAVRPKIWNNDKIDFWYKQNTLLFVRKSKLSDYPQLSYYANATFDDYLTRVHPVFFDMVSTQLEKISKWTGFFNWKWYSFKQRLVRKK